jgi:tRNA threonylcarbamoyladenosine biosynthesis protein TsaE
LVADGSITVETRGEEETVARARRFSGALLAGDVVALHGELGAGKTRFVRGLAEGLGHDSTRVSSPTFVLAHVYDDLSGRVALVHVDAYRLTSAEDLAALGWDRLADGSSVVAVEWAARIDDGLPGAASGSRFDVLIEHTGEEARRVTITPASGRGSQVAAALAPRRVHRCRICGGRADPSGAFAPFCSDRCRMADLGKWFSEDYRISREVKDSDLDAGE